MDCTECFEKLPNLTKLSMSLVENDDQCVSQFDNIAKCDGLTYLCIENKTPVEINTNGCTFLFISCDKLVEFRLINFIPNPDFDEIFPSFIKLTHLQLSHNTRPIGIASIGRNCTNWNALI